MHATPGRDWAAGHGRVGPGQVTRARAPLLRQAVADNIFWPSPLLLAFSSFSLLSLFSLLSSLAHRHLRELRELRPSSHDPFFALVIP